MIKGIFLEVDLEVGMVFVRTKRHAQSEKLAVCLKTKRVRLGTFLHLAFASVNS
jgi:hypothetical protein